MIIRYWWQVIRRALFGTIVFLGFSRPSRFAIALALFVVAIVILQAIGGKSQMEAEIRWGLATLITAGVFFIPIFIVNLLLTPAKLDQQRKNEVQRLQEETIRYKANKNVSDGLADFYRTLSGLISEKVTSEEQFKDWELRREKWWNDSVRYIDSNISHSESVLFSSTSVLTKSNEKFKFVNQYNEAHCGDLLSLKVLSEKLEILMAKYDKAIGSD